MKLELDIFEGPLDLLLYLIRKNDLEISRVSVSDITDQYLAFIETMAELDIDLAGEFLVMAAELAHIKSKTLLPDDGSDGPEDGEAVSDLVARLKEYQRYKLAAMELAKRRWLGRDVFTRGGLEDEGIPADEALLYEVDPFDLIRSFSEILRRLPKEIRSHHIAKERVSVTERIYELLEILKQKESVLFSDLFAADRTRVELVTSFLAILEMGRLGLTRMYQTETFAPIRVQRCGEIGKDWLDAAQTVDDFK